jgi:hypothetical protein
MNLPMNISEIKRPVKKGELFLVPCSVREKFGKTIITPLINHPHTDKESGQMEEHYHADYRFLKHDNIGSFPSIINNHSKHYYSGHARIIINKKDIQYIVLPVINEEHSGVTPTFIIGRSNFKHNCIHKGKCPHRGFDLRQIAPTYNGRELVIRCPLHGLEFSASNKKLLNKYPNSTQKK